MNIYIMKWSFRAEKADNFLFQSKIMRIIFSLEFRDWIWKEAYNFAGCKFWEVWQNQSLRQTSLLSQKWAPGTCCLVPCETEAVSGRVWGHLRTEVWSLVDLNWPEYKPILACEQRSNAENDKNYLWATGLVLLNLLDIDSAALRLFMEARYFFDPI